MVGLKVEAIVPKKRGRGAANQRKAIDLAYDRFTPILLNDLNNATKTWKKKPKFTIVRTRKGRDEIIAALTDDPRWNWISEGTGIYGPKGKAYWIFPVKAKALRFKSQYSPATAPNRIIAQAASSGGDTRFSKGVLHPGIKPRKLNARIAKRNQAKFKQFMDDAIREENR